MRRSGVRIPLSPPKKYHTVCVVFFYVKIRDSPRFHRGVALCNTNPCGLTLHFASKLARFAITEASKARFLRIPLSPPKKYHTVCVVFLYVKIRDSPRFHRGVALCNTNPCGLPASKERHKRVAFAEIVRSGHNKQTRHTVSRAMRGGATAPFV